MCKWLQQRGHDAKNANQAASEVLATLITSTQSEDGKWVLQQRETQHAEFSLTTADATQHKIDCTFVEAGERWIVDYKSAQLDEGLATKELSQQAKNYRPQLERYAELFKDEGLPIRKAVFFLALGKLIELN